MNSRERKNGNWIINIKRHLKNLRTRLQINLYSLFQRESKNSEWKLTLQNTLLGNFYPRNKKRNENPLYSY